MNKVILKFSFDHFTYSGAFLGHGLLVQFKSRVLGYLRFKLGKNIHVVSGFPVLSRFLCKILSILLKNWGRAE